MIEDVLQRALGFAGIEYVVWAEQQALVVNPAFVFPFGKYARSGKDIVMYGEMPGTLAGDVAREFCPPSLNVRAPEALLEKHRHLVDLQLQAA